MLRYIINIVRGSILIVISSTILPGCLSSGSKKDVHSPNLNKPVGGFRKFVGGFKTLSYPVKIATLEIDPNSYKKFTVFDNRFIKSQYPDEIYSYGILPDTVDNYKILWLAPAESLIPMLTIFAKDGTKIGEEEIGVGGCGSDCGFNCNELITINQNLQIFSVDSITMSQCDSTGVKPNTEKKYVRYKEGRILKSGKIKLSKIKQK